MRSPHSTTCATDESSAQPPPYSPTDAVPTVQGPTPIIVAVADRFLDDTARSRHQQQHRDSNNQVDNPSSTRPGVIVVNATPMPLSYSRSQSGCLTGRKKIIIGFQLLIMAIFFIVMSQTVWKHDSSGGSGGGNDNSNRDTSPGSRYTSTGPKQPEPSRNPDKPWLPCSPGCCLDFRIGCQNSCEATDLTYKSCVVGCGGNTTCEFACGRTDKPCFSTCATKHGMCREECKQ